MIYYPKTPKTWKITLMEPQIWWKKILDCSGPFWQAQTSLLARGWRLFWHAGKMEGLGGPHEVRGLDVFNAPVGPCKDQHHFTIHFERSQKKRISKPIHQFYELCSSQCQQSKFQLLIVLRISRIWPKDLLSTWRI